jgi:hypothetical protein
MEDLQKPNRIMTRLKEVLAKRGGKYRGFADGQESVMFNVYTNVEYSSVIPDHRGISVKLSLDAPPGRARASQSDARVNFWKHGSGNRLMQGGLIALIWKSGSQIDVHLGTVSSPMNELTDSAKTSRETICIRVIFFDPDVTLRILNALKRPETQRGDIKITLEVPGMFEAVRPFLEALRVEPESLPFAKYLVHCPPEFFESIKIDPPKYALVPGFSYQLASLFPPEAEVADLRMFPSNPASVAAARETLKLSRLDSSQADSVIDTLTRELSLIQG